MKGDSGLRERGKLTATSHYQLIVLIILTIIVTLKY